MSSRQSEIKRGIFVQIRAERIAEKVAEQLRKLVADGALKAGDRLPSERELSEEMGVSRTSVREAVQRLEFEGILETIHGGGSIIRNLTEQEIRRPIERFLKEDKKHVLELAELRAFMEAWAAREAAKKRTQADLQTIRAYLEEMEKDLEKGRIRYEVDFKFHTEIAAATHNTVYLHLVDNIYHLFLYSIKIHHEEVFVSREDQEMLQKQHRNVFAAIRDGNPDAAEGAMREHLTFVLEEFTRHFFSTDKG